MPGFILREALRVRTAPTDRSALLARRDENVRRLVGAAARHVPYYRELLANAGISPCDIRSADDLLRIPSFSKREMRAKGASLLSDRSPVFGLTTKYTTGSTGEPIRVTASHAEWALCTLMVNRAREEFGRTRHERTAVLSLHGGSPKPGGLRGALARVAAALHGPRLHLDCRRNPDELIAALEAFRPDVVLGYAGALALIGVRLQERPSHWRPKYVMSGSETLTSARRKQMTEGFCAPVYDYYASSEAGLIASQCPATGLYHIAEDHVVLHLEDNGRPVAMTDGARGETVVTNLHAYAMPFIRYRLSDLVTCGPALCPCGAPFATLRSIEGRWLDHFILADGTKLHPFAISEVFSKELLSFIKQYQLVQEATDRIVLRVVARPDWPAEERRALERRVCAFLGPKITFRTECVEQIQSEPTGKHKLSISHVPR